MTVRILTCAIEEIDKQNAQIILRLILIIANDIKNLADVCEGGDQ